MHQILSQHKFNFTRGTCNCWRY